MTSISRKSFHQISISSVSPEKLSDAEKRWVHFQPYLLSKGYQLRPRYRPDWVPSWTRTGANLKPYDCEDSVDSLPVRILDATRVSDQLQVIIKMIVPSEDDREGTEELAILQRLSAAPYQSHSANHTVPCLDVFPIPGIEDGAFCVMPLLTKYDEPPFASLLEIHDFLLQAFEGLEFLHKADIAHCDIASPNIMMNGRLLYDEPFHPFNQHLTLQGNRLIQRTYSRSQVPIRYYYIDFGYAKWFHNHGETRLVKGTRARELTPEQILGESYDPFKADVFQLGALIRRDLIPHYPTLRFLLPLAREMTHHDPDKRPTLEQANYIMNTHFVGISSWRMHWPIIPVDSSWRQWCIAVVTGIVEQFVLFLRRATQLLSMA